jgi:hypothetical protein
MAKSTGIILAVGGVTVFNQVILIKKEIDWRVPVATGFAAMAFSLLEKVNQTLTVGVAWVALLTVLLVRIDPKQPAPVETLLKTWNQE